VDTFFENCKPVITEASFIYVMFNVFVHLYLDNPGPNYIIFIDGYEKLKPFGICIHGKTNGYSQKLLRLGIIMLFQQ